MFVHCCVIMKRHQQCHLRTTVNMNLFHSNYAHWLIALMHLDYCTIDFRTDCLLMTDTYTTSGIFGWVHDYLIRYLIWYLIPKFPKCSSHSSRHAGGWAVAGTVHIRQLFQLTERARCCSLPWDCMSYDCLASYPTSAVLKSTVGLHVIWLLRFLVSGRCWCGC